MSSPVTAASYVGTPPAVSILMPDDGDPRTAAWIRALAAVVLANDDYLNGLINAVAPDLLAANNTWTGTNTYGGTVTWENTSTHQLPVVLEDGAEVTGGNIELDTGVQVTFASARTYERTLDNLPLYDAAHWLPALDADSMIPVFTSQSISGGQSEIVWVFRAPTSATVTAVSVYLTPASGHASVPAVTLSVAKLLRTAISAVASASVSDPAGSVGAYETPHELPLTGLSLTFSEGDLLIIRLTPETGAGAATGLRTSQPKVSFTRTTLAEE